MASPMNRGKKRRQTRLTFEPAADADAAADANAGGGVGGGTEPGVGLSSSPARVRYSHPGGGGRTPSKPAPVLIIPPGQNKSRSRQKRLNMPVSAGRSLFPSCVSNPFFLKLQAASTNWVTQVPWKVPTVSCPCCGGNKTVTGCGSLAIQCSPSYPSVHNYLHPRRTPFYLNAATNAAHSQLHADDPRR